MKVDALYSVQEIRGKSMRITKLSCRTERKPTQVLLGWIFAMFFVSVAVFGPALTGQGVPVLMEISHDVLTIDREFERSFLRPFTSASPNRTAIGASDEVGRASSTSESKMLDRGDLS
jgi:hypothetical protein